jgi:hypothetical protein
MPLPEYSLFLQNGKLALLSLETNKVLEVWPLPELQAERYRITLSRLAELNNILEAFVDQLGVTIIRDALSTVGTGDTSWIVVRFVTSVLLNLKMIAKETA